MKQEDIDRILQLVAYIKNMDYQTKQVMMDGSNYDRMFTALQSARQLLAPIVNSLRWRSAYPGITYDHSDAYVSFTCQCGQIHTFSEGGDSTTCDCGRVYRLQLFVEVDSTLLKGG